MDTQKRPKHIVILDHERMPRKTAMLTAATNNDQYLADGQWHSTADGQWRHGQIVDEVKHFGRHQTAVGDVIVAERIDGVVIAHVQVVSIVMADADALTNDDLTALGYASREEYQGEWGTAIGKKVWLMTITHLTPQAAISLKPQ